MKILATNRLGVSALVLVAASLVAGCKMGQALRGEWKRYRGPVRPASELALLCVQECTMMGCSLKVSKVDGRRPGGMYALQAFPPNTKGKLCFELLPGAHELDAQYRLVEDDAVIGTDQFTFEASVEAGTTYFVQPVVVGDRVTLKMKPAGAEGAP